MNINATSNRKFILTKRSRVGETWVKKYLKSFAFDLKYNYTIGVSTNDIKEALTFTSEKQIENLRDEVWSKEYI